MTVHAGRHADALRPLQHAEREELRQSIEAHGVQIPIIVDQHGTIIDGHHRWAIAAELGVHCPVVQHDVDDDEEAAEIARTVNVARRHIDPATWATLVADRRQRVAAARAAGRSLREIAKTERVSKTTVIGDLQVVTPDHLPEQTTGADGKTYPATRPAPVVDDEPWDDEPDPYDEAVAEFPCLTEWPRDADMLRAADSLRSIPEGPKRDARIAAAETWPKALAARDRIAESAKQTDSHLFARAAGNADRLAEVLTELVDADCSDAPADERAEWAASFARLRDHLNGFISALTAPTTLRRVK